MKRLKQFWIMFVIVVFSLAMIPVGILAEGEQENDVVQPTIIAQGDCGDQGYNVKWQLDEEGTLTIYAMHGTWIMKDYNSYSSVPWYSYRKSIKQVIVELGVTSIGNYAFFDCSSLTSVNIPERVMSIGAYAFAYCSSLTNTNIPESVTSIGHHAFSGCGSLKSISIPDGVTSIGNGAFSSAGVVHVDQNNQYYKSIDGVLYHKSGETLIHCPVFAQGVFNIPNGVTSIDDDAFERCSNLTSVNIPDGVKGFGDHAFYGCSSLTRITLPEGATNIGMYAFAFCSSLKSINIPDSMTSIGKAAFDYCSSLTSIYFPEGVTRIGDDEFSGCSSLTSIYIPKSVMSISYYAFHNCSLKDVYYGGTEAQWYNLSNRPSCGTVHYNCVLPESISVEPIETMIKKGDSITSNQLLFLPEDTTVKYIEWSSSDDSIVTVNESGVLTGVKEGTATVTARTINGLEASCVVTVTGECDHQFGEQWQSDAKEHWKTCLVEGCDATQNRGAHTDTNNDKYCDVCDRLLSCRVSVTSAIEGTDTTIAHVSGGGLYSIESGEAAIEVLATQVAGYDFIGWYEGDELVSTDLKYSFTTDRDIHLVAVYRPVESGMFSLKISGTTFRLEIDGKPESGVQNNYYAQIKAGSKITLTYADQHEDVHFIRWKNDNNGTLSREEIYQFTLLGDTTIVGVSNTESTGQVLVEFVTAYEQIWQAKIQTTEDDIVFPPAPSKFGHKFVNWEKDSEDIKAAISSGETHIVIKPVYQQSENTYTIQSRKRIGETSTEYVDQITERIGTVATITAESEYNSNPFSYWEDESGNVVSYNVQYVLKPMAGVLRLTAVYGEDCSPIPVVTMSAPEKEHSGYYKLYLNTTLSTPVGYTPMEIGIIRTTVESYGTEKQLIVENVDRSNVKRTNQVISEKSAIYSMIINATDPDRIFYVRGYAKIKNNSTGVIKTFYSNIVCDSYNGVLSR